MRITMAAMVMMLLTQATIVHAEVQVKTIIYQAGETKLIGYMAYNDSATDKRPCVLVVHDWTGLNDYARMRARMLAELGYVGFAVDMYGNGKVAADAKEASQLAGEIRGDHALLLARMKAAIDAAGQQPQVDPHRLAIIGYCFGGGVALETARSGADVRAVVSFHGNLNTHYPAKADTLKASILICHGTDDQAVPQKDVSAAMDEMKAAKADWELIQFGNAVHAFSDPHNAERYNKAADLRSWAAMKEFLSERLNGAIQ